MFQKESLFLNLQIIKKGQSKIQELYATQTASVTKRRKQKISKNKSTQQRITESYTELMHYIDNLDERVQQIIKTYEIQFLQAYNSHIKKVKYEMQQLKQSSLNNANSQKALQEKIDSMQKQLRIFRQQSLKLFDKVTTKDKQLNKANLKIKQLQKQNKQNDRTIYQLTKRNKQLQVFYQNHKHNQTSIIKQINDSQDQNKKNNYIQKQHVEMATHRPFTTTYRSKSYYNQHKKSNKAIIEQDRSNSHFKMDKMDKKSNGGSIKHPLILNETGIAIEANGQIAAARQIRSQSHQYKRKINVKFDNEIKLKSYLFSQRQKYIKIFKNCVQQVKSQINKKSKIVSLNFFKQNGPINFVQFKKQDFYTLLQLLLTNQSILMEFYKMIFNRQPEF